MDTPLRSRTDDPAATRVSRSDSPSYSLPGCTLPFAFVMLYALCTFAITYCSDIYRPGAAFPNGWYQVAFDQSKYFDMVRSIPNGSFGEFRYPPVYPLLGVLGGLVYPSDPFLPVNGLLFVVFLGLTFLLLGRFLDQTLSLVGSLLVAHASVPLFVMPWTSTVSAPCLAYVLYTLLKPPSSFRQGVAVGTALGLMFGARIGDVFVGGLAIAAATVWWWLSRTEARRFLAGVAFGGIAIVSAVIAINLAFTHTLLGDYTKGILSQGFFLTAIPFKLYGYALNPLQFHGEWAPTSRSLFQILPLWVLSPLGVACLIADRRHRLAGAIFLASVAGWLAIYAPFVAVGALSLKYGALHYSKLLFPILVGCSLKTLSLLQTEVSEKSDPQRSPDLLFGMSRRTVLLGYVIGFTLLIGTISMVRFPLLDLSKATASASHNSAKARNAIDGDPATRWDTGQVQAPGQSFQLDLGRISMIGRIVLDCRAAPHDTPRSLGIFVSKDGERWERLIFENQTTQPEVGEYFADLTPVRYLRFEQYGVDQACFWSIFEVRLYGW